MYLLTLWLGKIIIAASRLAGNNGVALPGYIIERINRSFLKRGLAKLPGGVIIVTGTNGKTTTTKMIADVLEASGTRVLTNKSGSNFVRSIISVIVDKSSMSGKLPYDLAILEQDEAYAARLVEQYSPRGVVALNVVRDQMDRFGEIDTTAKFLQKVVESATDFAVLSDHDPRVARLETNAKRVYFDVDEKIASEFPNDDEWHGSKAKAPSSNKHGASVVLVDFADHEATYKVDGSSIKLHLQATGQHNFLNAAAALATLRALLPNEAAQDLAAKLGEVPAAFGRGEELVINGVDLRLQLIKNPASFTAALKLAGKKDYSTIAILINDDHADSRDVSWLWDVDFQSLGEQKGQLITGGTRAHDMALRLKYDQLDTARIIPDNKELINSLLTDAGKNVLLFCTYTAMWQIRKELTRQGHVQYVR